MAISLYSANNANGLGTSWHCNYSAPYGAVLVVFVGTNNNGTSYLSGVTANGVSMTEVAVDDANPPGDQFCFFLGNPPATGSGQVTVSFSGDTGAGGGICALVFQNSNNEEAAAGDIRPGGVTHNTNSTVLSLTTVTNNAVIVTSSTSSGGGGITVPTGYTSAVATFADGQAKSMAAAYSPAIATAGSQSLTWTFGDIQSASTAVALSPGSFPGLPNGLFMVSD
jgi:hypothetical protein